MYSCLQVLERSGCSKHTALWQSVAQSLLQCFDVVSRVHQRNDDQDACCVRIPFELFVLTSRLSGSIECAPPRCARLSVRVLALSGDCYSSSPAASQTATPAGRSPGSTAGVGVLELWTLVVSSRVELLELAIAAYTRAVRSASGRVGSLWHDIGLAYLWRALALEHRVRHVGHVATQSQSQASASGGASVAQLGDVLELPTELAPLDIRVSRGGATCPCARCAPLVLRARSDRELALKCAQRAIALEPNNSNFFLLLAFLCGVLTLYWLSIRICTAVLYSLVFPKTI